MADTRYAPQTEAARAMRAFADEMLGDDAIARIAAGAPAFLRPFIPKVLPMVFAKVDEAVQQLDEHPDEARDSMRPFVVRLVRAFYDVDIEALIATPEAAS